MLPDPTAPPTEKEPAPAAEPHPVLTPPISPLAGASSSTSENEGRWGRGSKEEASPSGTAAAEPPPVLTPGASSSTSENEGRWGRGSTEDASPSGTAAAEPPPVLTPGASSSASENEPWVREDGWGRGSKEEASPSGTAAAELPPVLTPPVSVWAWDARSHAVFSKLAREFKGRTRSALFARLQLELPVRILFNDIDRWIDKDIDRCIDGCIYTVCLSMYICSALFARLQLELPVSMSIYI